MRFYHGSSRPLVVGQRLGGRRNELLEPLIEELLESRRPRTQPSRGVAVFMVGDKRDVETAGGALDYVYEVEPLTDTYPHHLSWYARINGLLRAHRPVKTRNGWQRELYLPDASLARARRFADAYWSGADPEDDHGEPWEYLTRAAEVVRRAPSPRRRYDE